MSSEIELKYWERLVAEGALRRSDLPNSVKRSPALRQLLLAEILVWERRGAGQVLVLRDEESFVTFLNNRYPGREEATAGTAVGNVARYRNTKAGSRENQGVVLLRGFADIELNDEPCRLAELTRRHGCTAAVFPQLKADKVCLVENLDSFLQAEVVLGEEWTFLHTYGRLGKDALPGLECRVLYHFGDYDFTGLDEYLRLQEQHPQAKLFVPEGLEDYWHRYSAPLKKEAQPSRRVQQSTLPEVVSIRELLARSNRFLEQQVLFYDKTHRS